MSPNPQAAGFWQPAQGPPAGIGAAFGEPAPTAKAESCFSTRSPRHAGQTGVTPSRMRTSNLFPQSAHVYSKSGMTASIPHGPGAAPGLT